MSERRIEKRKRVILYGHSLILGTLGESLKRYPELEIIPLQAPFQPVESLAELAPDVILLDVTSARPEPAWVLLERCPSLLVIGLDPSNEKMLVLSSRSTQAFSAEDLIHIMRQKDVFLESFKNASRQQHV